jgi:hypothetical protein
LFTKESADTLYQPIGDYQTAGNYVSASELTAYATTSLVSSVSSTITGMIPTGDFELVGGTNIELVDDPVNHTTTINMTADIPSTAGLATEDWVTAQGYITNDAITGKQDITGMTAYQAAGDYLSANALDNLSGNWETVTAKQDALTFSYNDTAISSIDNSALYDNSAHARITTLAGRISDLSSNKLDTTAFSDVSGNFLTEVPAGTMNESAFSYDASDNITAYNGSAFKAGDEFPQSATEAIETVTSNSADWNGTTDTVSSNSGVWGGSALPISAGPGIKFEMVNDTLVASTQGPILDEITTAGTWNGREVKQMLLTGTFSTNANSDVIPVNSAYSAYERKWIDPSNSFIFYGSSANILPSTWVLGATGRLGSLSLLNGIVRARSNDTTDTPCTAFVTIKWCEN